MWIRGAVAVLALFNYLLFHLQFFPFSQPTGSISLAIALIVTTLGMPFVSDCAQFRSLLSAAVYQIDCLTALFDCFVPLEYYYPEPVLAPRACAFAIDLCNYIAITQSRGKFCGIKPYIVQKPLLCYTKRKKRIVQCTKHFLGNLNNPIMYLLLHIQFLTILHILECNRTLS